MRSNILICWLACFLGCEAIHFEAQGNTFSYQGMLNTNGTAASGSFDFQFSLYDASTNGNLVSGPVTNLAVNVSSGLFTTNLDFGAVFTGTNYWLAIGVRTNGSTNAFSLLQPLQPLLPVPYAIFANSASNLSGTLSADQISGTLSSQQLSGTYTGTVIFNNSGNDFSGSFAGNGSGLANLNGSQIASGTVADLRLSANVAFLNGNQKFTGSNVFTGVDSFTNRASTFIGNFFGNGLVGWIPVSVTTTQAMPDAGYLLLNSNLTTVTLPPTSALTVSDVVRVSGAGAGGWIIAQNTNQAILGNFSSYSQNAWLPSTISSMAWVSMASSASGSMMAAVANSSGAVYFSQNEGYSWSTASAPNDSFHCVACSADGSHLMITEYPGSIFYSTNFGSSWPAGTGTGQNNYWYSIAMSANGLNAVAGGNGVIYTSSNAGATWQQQTSGLPGSVYWLGVASSADGTKLVAVNTSGGVYTSTNSGLNWSSVTVGSGSLTWSSVASSADGTKLVAASDNGGIYTSINAGASWRLSGAVPANYVSVISSADGAKIVAVVNGGGISASIDFGSTWITQPVSTQSWSAICGSSDGTHLAAAISEGGIYYSSVSALTSTTVGTNGYIAGPQFSAVELQYLGNGQFMPISSSGTYWGN